MKKMVVSCDKSTLERADEFNDAAMFGFIFQAVRKILMILSCLENSAPFFEQNTEMIRAVKNTSYWEEMNFNWQRGTQMRIIVHRTCFHADGYVLRLAIISIVQSSMQWDT